MMSNTPGYALLLSHILALRDVQSSFHSASDLLSENGHNCLFLIGLLKRSNEIMDVNFLDSTWYAALSSTNDDHYFYEILGGSSFQSN